MPQFFILIAEDDTVDRYLIMEALQRTNLFYKIVITNNVQDAISYMSKADRLPDLILSDLIMPKNTGFDLFREIRKDNRFNKIPFFIYSSCFSSKDIKTALTLGVEIWMRKPETMPDYIQMSYKVWDFVRQKSISN